MQSVKRLVSGNKARFQDPELKLELDLVYLTDQPNVILMGFPAQGLAALYRNDRAQVLTFLNSRHGDKFRIYNFVPTWENSYDADYFGGRVSRFPFPDHHAPPLSLISLFVTDIAHWLEGDPERAAAIHCKAGKGRTGTMAIAYLLSLPYMPRGPSEINNLIRTSSKSKHKSKSNVSLQDPAQSSSSLPRSTPKVLIDTASGPSNAASLQDGGPSTATGSASPISMTSNSPATPLSAHGGHPDPDYLFALHTRQRMKPKFSDKDWISHQLQRHPSAASSLLSKASRQSLSSSPASEAKASDTTKADSQSQPNGISSEAPGFDSKTFDAVVQATADAAGPHATLPRFSKAADQKAEDQPKQAGVERNQSPTSSTSSSTSEAKDAPRKFGVSISSQRRFVGYWFRILHGQDARAPVEHMDNWKGSPTWGSGLRGQRKARIVEIILHRDQPGKQSVSSKFIDDHIRVHLSRYDDGLVKKLEDEEWRVRTGPKAILTNTHAGEAADPNSNVLESATTTAAPANGDAAGLHENDDEKSEAKARAQPTLREDAVERARTFDWGDANSESKYHNFATFKRADDTDDVSSESQTSKSAGASSTTRGLRMIPSDHSSSLTVDPDREVLLTAFLSKAHAKLPHVASLASVWVVPSFEDVIQDAEDVEAVSEDKSKSARLRRFRTRFGKDDLDWRKGVSGIVGIEIVWEVE
ncbi:unnamed protein product [Tilletia controversa]|uniref:phosphatidylinositol-3,4,5-trisphosphate 3-phosphatase n=3 Tax=Tilletia TaxID=13289 RepID=A0A8X7SZT2_9BASI|nr:hypothetical protein CF336_g1799 [Tilletia laevis]KAE8205001.1 hypothetical protein CF328_g753 [Tilletia controversa]KAE8263938.1 hypothetical protein A4X03_0g1322 [Tilletia caries]KAE8207438.1 hypothetical protein CF335_g1137 [Tilletia laevis]KAE8254559.1 hypothetical protein A4X06_0g838 [Tilletia controversa]